MSMTRCFTFGVAVAFALCVPAVEMPAAQADGGSFIRYINDNNIFLPAINDSYKIRVGADICTLLHNGMSPDEIAQSYGGSGGFGFGARIAVFDVPRTMEAAQHELCPDTLH